MEKQHNPSASSLLQFPPGFRFHPSDEELIVYYLRNKVTSLPIPASVIAEVDLYKYNPWELPKKALFGEDEWFFFSPRERKYPNGERPNRAAASGYWKATGTDKPILSSTGSQNLGVKKALVFYSGKPPKGVKTDWMMNEYRLVDTRIKPSRSKGSMRLDDWVLCRVRHKSHLPKTAWDTRKAELGPKVEKAPPPIDAVSSLSCQGSNNINNSILAYEDAADRVNSLLTVSSKDTYFSPLKRKPSEENWYENLLSSKKNPISLNRDLDFPFSKVLPDNDISYYGQCQEGIYENPSDTSIDFLELNELAVTGKYL